MNDRHNRSARRLPEASSAFTQAMLEGAAKIRRYERGRRRASRFTLAAAALALIALGLGAAVTRLSAPRSDNVALSENLRGMGAEGGEPAMPEEATQAQEETSPPDATPPRSRLDPETGLTCLLDDGPFEPGERLVLTDQDGLLVYDLTIPFHEQPFGESRSAVAVMGMQVYYLGEAENGFSRVHFAGNEGYVESRFLRRGTPLPTLNENGSWEVAEAMLYITDEIGILHAENIDEEDAVACYALTKLLEELEPAASEAPDDEKPSGALLVLRMLDADGYKVNENGEVLLTDLRFTLDKRGGSVKGDLELAAEDGERYVMPASDAPILWSLFPETAAATWW